ncbi:hypothetical protein [Streptomyces sp. NPDC093149]|uniref:hypothetical protein n=1 Tax=Streptomyces sp. NPDC093149 TaxID=3366031 RepID=UPI00381BF856
MERLTRGCDAPVTQRAHIVAVVARPEDLTTPCLRGLAGVADALEVRADLVGDPDPHRLRRHFTGPVTYSLRSPRHGGCSAVGPVERRTRLLRAADHYDVVDLEAVDDLVPELLAGIPARQRRVSWHQPEPARPERSADRGAGVLEASAELRERFAAMATTPALLYLLVPQPGAQYGAASPLLLTGLGRSDVTTFASGPAGTWTRVLAPWLGAPLAFGRAGTPGADGMPSVGQLVTDYGLPALPPLSALFGIAGHAPGRSLSPRLHNAALRELRLPALYLPFQVDTFPRFWHCANDFGALARLPLLGLTVTAPHKQSAVEAADIVGPQALRCGAANVLWHDAGRWRAGTTDTAAALHILARAGVDPSGRRAAVIGCGSTGQAVALALLQAGARVTLVNRRHARGREASSRLGAPYVPLSRFSPAGHAVLVHATPLAERQPFPVSAVDPDAAVVEMVYRDPPTALMNATRARGLIGIDGRDVLLVEVSAQFRLLTGHPLPDALPMRSLCFSQVERVDAPDLTEPEDAPPAQSRMRPTSGEAS